MPMEFLSSFEFQEGTFVYTPSIEKSHNSFQEPQIELQEKEV
jgi:hypothetical protein